MTLQSSIVEIEFAQEMYRDEPRIAPASEDSEGDEWKAG
jgi:hypothetical protein